MAFERCEVVREQGARVFYQEARFIRVKPSGNYGLSASNLSYRASVAHVIRRRCQKGAKG